MEIIFLLLAISILIVPLIAWAFLWAVDNEQFDDLEAAGRSILMDDDRTEGSDANRR